MGLRPSLGHGPTAAYSILRKRTIQTTMIQNMSTRMFMMAK